jgi:hypothetical protein
MIAGVMIEQVKNLLGMQEVWGSIPHSSINEKPRFRKIRGFLLWCDRNDFRAAAGEAVSGKERFSQTCALIPEKDTGKIISKWPVPCLQAPGVLLL